MKNLSINWITDNRIDFEYKKYLLLAYLQQVSENFDEQRLYPFLSDLVEHYRNLLIFKDNKKNLLEKFSGKLKGFDFESFKIIYEKIVEDDAIMQELESIVAFSIPQMEVYLKEGKKIFDYIEEQLKLFPVGIVPLHREFGYLLLKNGGGKEAKVYEYQITIFDSPNERFRGIHTNFLNSFELSISNTFETIKKDLIRMNRSLPNPATYVIETNIQLPHEETFLPIAKRMLVKHVATDSAS